MIRVNDGDSRRPSFSEVLLMEKGLASTKLFDSMPVSLLSTGEHRCQVARLLLPASRENHSLCILAQTGKK